MGQKANPIGNRLGIIRGWESSWYSKKDSYATKLIEDNTIRNFIRKRNPKVGIAKIVIERTLGKLTVTIHTSKPGILIGKGGAEVDLIKEDIKKLINHKDIQLNILEVRKPELDAYVVAETIAQQIENRMHFKRVAKMAIASTMRAGAEGIKIKLGGRLGGAEIARSEEYKEGRVPLHTFRMDIDYASIFALTVYGKIGIKVWICRGEVLSRRDLNLNFATKSASGGGFAGGEREQRFGGGNRRPQGGGGGRPGGGFNRGGGDNRTGGGERRPFNNNSGGGGRPSGGFNRGGGDNRTGGGAPRENRPPRNS